MTLLELAQKHKLVRRSLIFWMMALTTHVFMWAMHFIDATPKTGADVGLMVGAITGPLALLQGYVFKLYNDARDGDQPS